MKREGRERKEERKKEEERKEVREVKYLVVKCWSDEEVECEVDEGVDALEVLERHDHNMNNVALVPLGEVLKALRKAKESRLIVAEDLFAADNPQNCTAVAAKA